MHWTVPPCHIGSNSTSVLSRTHLGCGPTGLGTGFDETLRFGALVRIRPGVNDETLTGDGLVFPAFAAGTAVRCFTFRSDGFGFPSAGPAVIAMTAGRITAIHRWQPIVRPPPALSGPRITGPVLFRIMVNLHPPRNSRRRGKIIGYSIVGIIHFFSNQRGQKNPQSIVAMSLASLWFLKSTRVVARGPSLGQSLEGRDASPTQLDSPRHESAVVRFCGALAAWLGRHQPGLERPNTCSWCAIRSDPSVETATGGLRGPVPAYPCPSKLTMLRTPETRHLCAVRHEAATEEQAQVTIMASRVRQNALSAAIAAALMIYFGFFSLLEPSGPGLFNGAALAMYHTLRIGGIAMALVALWSLLGDRTVLLVDGIASTVIGVLFVLAAVGLLLGGGRMIDSVLYVVFGSMFVSSGLRNYREYFHLAHLAELGHQSDPASQTIHGYPPPSRASTVDTDAAPEPGMQFESSKQQASTHGQAPSAIGEVEAALEQDIMMPPPSRVEDGVDQTCDEQDAEPDSGGFLASFAEEEPPPRI